LRLVLLGAPGAGKGTIAKTMSQRLHAVHISTGDMLREAVAEGTQVGLAAKSYMDAGDLVPDDVVVGVLLERIEKPDCAAGFVLDGFPRTVPQADALQRGLAERGLSLDLVIDLVVPEETVIQRLSGRRQCKACGAIFHVTNMPPKVEGVCDACGGELYQRDDDKPATIRERLATFAQKTAPLREFYDGLGLARDLDASVGPEETYQGLVALLTAEGLLSAEGAGGAGGVRAA